MAPFLGKGGNQAIQDAHCLALAVSSVGTHHESLGQALQFYQRCRKPVTDALIRGSGTLGWIETQGGVLGCAFRNSSLFFSGRMGIPEKLFFRAALPVFN